MHQVIADVVSAVPALIHKPNSQSDSPIVNAVATYNSHVTKLSREFCADPNQVGSCGNSVLAVSSLHIFAGHSGPKQAHCRSLPTVVRQ